MGSESPLPGDSTFKPLAPMNSGPHRVRVRARLGAYGVISASACFAWRGWRLSGLESLDALDPIDAAVERSHLADPRDLG
jgi:hypothetical protein